jgi:hypothetical protein
MQCVADTFTWTVMAATWGLLALSFTYTLRTRRTIRELRKELEQ